tara:strand:- start:6896 stop:9337 length:2442 start_codon:yes stop_codon:yes gene_type:complete
MNDKNNILGLYRFNIESYDSNTNNTNQPITFIEFDDNRNQNLLRNSNLTFNPSTNTLHSTNINASGTHTIGNILNNNATFSIKEKNDNAVMTISTENTSDTTQDAKIELDQDNRKITLNAGDGFRKFTINVSNRYELENINDVRLSFNDSNAPTDQKFVEIVNSDGSFIVKNYSDSHAAADTPMQIIRNTNSVNCSDILFNVKTNFTIRNEGGSVEKFHFDIVNSKLTCTTIDATNLELTNLKALDGTSCGSIANSTGVFTIDSSVLTTTDINGGTIDGCDITVGTGKTLDVTNGTFNVGTVNVTNLQLTNLKALDGTSCGSIANSTGIITLGSSVLTTTDINAGTIDGCDITVGSGKTLNVSAGTLTLADNQISGDKVEGGTINATTINTLTTNLVTGSGGSMNLSTGHFGGSLFDTTPEATANSILFTRTATVNGRRIIYGSNITFDSSTNILSHTGDINIATGKNYKINGTQISSANLSNDSSLVKVASNRSTIGNLTIGNWTASADFSMLRNSSLSADNDYALLQQNTGATFINSKAGQVLNLGIGNSYKLVVGTGGDVTLSNNLILSTGQVNFPYFQVFGNSANFMGALGFNRNLSTGAILNSTFDAFQVHNNNGKLHFQNYLGSDGSEIDANTLVLVNGEVGIGHAVCDEKLDVNGTVKASSFDPSSDDRLKKNETKITNALNIINKLSCETYDKVKQILYKKNPPTNIGLDNFTSTDEIDWDLDNYSASDFMKEAGFIAQEVEQINELKDYIKVGNENKIYTINYNSIFTYAVAAIQELSQENTELKNKISNLEADILLIKNNLSI